MHLYVNRKIVVRAGGEKALAKENVLVVRNGTKRMRAQRSLVQKSIGQLHKAIR